MGIWVAFEGLGTPRGRRGFVAQSRGFEAPALQGTLGLAPGLRYVLTSGRQPAPRRTQRWRQAVHSSPGLPGPQEPSETEFCAGEAAAEGSPCQASGLAPERGRGGARKGLPPTPGAAAETLPSQGCEDLLSNEKWSQHHHHGEDQPCSSMGAPTCRSERSRAIGRGRAGYLDACSPGLRRGPRGSPRNAAVDSIVPGRSRALRHKAPVGCPPAVGGCWGFLKE